MRYLNTNTLFIASVALLATSCKPDIDVPAASAGSANFSKYVSIGNSITSGYADNALYYTGQTVAYPNLIAQQLKLVGGGDFKQPWVPQSSVGFGSSGNARLVLKPATDCKGVTSLAPVPVAATGDFSIISSIYATQGPFNNMGVPGAKAITVVYPSYGDPSHGPGNYNPYFYRMASDPATASMLSDAAAQNATFFSLFIGNNDVLSYALAGGEADAITPSAGAVGVGFDASIDAIVNAMTANGAKGVIGNVPNITSLPYFTTVPANGLTLDANTAAALTAAYAGTGITFSAGSNRFIIADASSPLGFRQIAASGEYILLGVPQDSLKCAQWGSVKPIPEKYVLDATEVNDIYIATLAYNNKLRTTASAKGLAYVDVNSFMASVKAGLTYNGVTFTTTFVSGGAFSLDGIHLTPFGNAMLANKFLEAINAQYGAKIPMVEVSNYHGVSFP